MLCRDERSHAARSGCVREEYRVPHLRHTPARRDEAVTGDCVRRARSRVVSRDFGAGRERVSWGRSGRDGGYNMIRPVISCRGPGTRLQEGGSGASLDGNASAT